MLKKRFSFRILVIFLLALSMVSQPVLADEVNEYEETANRMIPYEVVHSGLPYDIQIIDNYIDQGTIGISIDRFASEKVKLMITKDGTNYTYDLQQNGSFEFFPFQLGDGLYRVDILENTTGNSYRYVRRLTYEVMLEDTNSVYLQPMQYNDWTYNKEFMEWVDELTESADSNEEIIQVLYDHLVENFGYDYDKAATVTPGYLPDLSLALDEQIGICYDYSAIYSAALRYKGIPTKLIKGYTTHVNGYHAWNEVLTDEGWVTVDVTVDAFYDVHNMAYEFEKDSSDYQTVNYY